MTDSFCQTRRGRASEASAGVAQGFWNRGVAAFAAALVLAGADSARAGEKGERGDPGKPLPFIQVGNPLFASNASVSDQFGESVDVDGNYAIVGAWLEDNERGINAGSAYVYRWTGTQWVQEAKLLAPDGMPDDRFGQSAAIYGDRVVVGSSLADVNGIQNAGAAYVYRRVGGAWVFETKLRASDPAANDRFAISADISESGIAIGAHREERLPGLDQGAVYMFYPDRGSWIELAKLTAFNAANNDWFGFRVAMDGTTLFVGAQNDDTTVGLDTGSVYVFKFDMGVWTFAQKLVASDASIGANFGSAIDIQGNQAIIGAERDLLPGVGRVGAAYIFSKVGGSWVQELKLTGEQPAADDFFGSGVGISGDFVIVAAEADDAAGLVDTGTIRSYQRMGGVWLPGPTFTSPNAQANQFFGAKVSYTDGLLVVGSPFADLPGVTDAGVTFSFAADSDCNANGEGDASDIALGVVNDINGNGVPDNCECLSDWDQSGGLSSLDVIAYLNDWTLDQSNGTLTGDINVNGVTNAVDFSDFLSGYFFGCVGL